LFADIVRQLEAAQAIAVTQAPDDSTVLQAQLDALVQQVDALQTLNQTIGTTAAAQVEALHAQRQGLIDAYTATAVAVQVALDTQTEAIRQAALDEVAAIRDNLTVALTGNATQQAALAGVALGVEVDQLNALNAYARDFRLWAQWDADRTVEANTILGQIKAAIEGFAPTAANKTLAAASMPAAAMAVGAPVAAGAAPPPVLGGTPGFYPGTSIPIDTSGPMTAVMVEDPFSDRPTWNDPRAAALQRTIYLMEDRLQYMTRNQHYWDSQHRMRTRFSADALGAQAAMVQVAHEALTAYLATLPHAATGMPLVPRDMAIYAHAGEAVLKPDEGRAYRTGLWSGGRGVASTGGAVTVTFGDIHITVTGGDDPERISEAVWRKLKRRIEDEARGGVLGDILAKR
jgi:hypothetical protein